MKILYIIDSLKSGGKERRLTSLLKYISRDSSNKIKVIVMNPDIHYKNIYDLPLDVIIISKNVKLVLFFKLFLISLKFRPDIVHSWDGLSSFAMAVISPITGGKLVTSIITDAPTDFAWNSKSGLIYRLSFLCADLILANSVAGLKAYKVKDKSIVIYNGYDFDRLGKYKTRSLPSDSLIKKFVVTMIASFTKNKDHKTFIDAAATFKNNKSSVVFQCIGNGDKMESVIRYAESLDLDNIRFIGAVENVDDYIISSDIGVLLTNTTEHGEGIPNALVEFMAFSKPVIATRSGGVGELIADGIDGILITPFSVEELIAAIDKLIVDNNYRLCIGKEAAKKIISKFNLHDMVVKIIEAYSYLCENK